MSLLGNSHIQVDTHAIRNEIISYVKNETIHINYIHAGDLEVAVFQKVYC